MCAAGARQPCGLVGSLPFLMAQQVPQLTDLRASGPAVIASMVQKCGPQIYACVNDPECKAALDCLQACSPTDQASTVRTLHYLSMQGGYPVVVLSSLQKSRLGTSGTRRSPNVPFILGVPGNC